MSAVEDESPKILVTKDGSHTLYHSQLNETYHSNNGAVQESLHVFIDAGLKYFIDNNQSENNIHILELGFGTGLNAMLTFIECNKQNIACNYHGIEAFPVDFSIVEQLNYTSWMNEEEKNIFMQMHLCEWNKNMDLSNQFSLYKNKSKIEEINTSAHQQIDIVYMDAFDPAKQPELWTELVFQNIYNRMNDGGILVTYSSKGDVKRALRSVGFTLERLEGPVGKRHMLRARKC